MHKIKKLRKCRIKNMKDMQNKNSNIFQKNINRLCKKNK